MSPLKRRIADLMNRPLVEFGILGLIFLSVVLVLVEFSTAEGTASYERLADINDALTAFFVLELLIRFYIEPIKRRFFRKYWIDILAVAPFFRSLRILRIFRLLRLFRFGIFLSKRLSQLRGGMHVIRAEYILIALSLIVSVVIGAFSIQIAEGRTNDDFKSLENAFWFSLMSIIGGEPIGGDPKSSLGKAITVALMLSGITVFGLLIGTVSAVMSESLRNIRFRSMEIDELEDHVVICGWNRAGRLLIEELLHDKKFKHVVVISEDANLQHEPIFHHLSERLYFLHGDFTRQDILERAGIRRASFAMLLADSSKEDRSSQDRDARSVLGAMLIEKINRKIYTVVQLLNRDNEVSLRQVGVEEIIVSDEYVGNIMATVAKNRGIVSVLDELLTAKYGHQFYRGPVLDSLHGKSVAEALVILKKDHDATLLAVDLGEGERLQERVRVNPPRELILKREHHIIVAASRTIF